jgi:hypothetical protein
MTVRDLAPGDAAAFQRLRLEGLRESPSAFASSDEEERHLSLEVVAERLAPDPGRCVVGAFRDHGLVGVAGLVREGKRKLAHKAFVWGVYVTPSARRSGAGRLVMLRLLERAASMPGVRQVYLGVNASNEPARRLYESLGFTVYGREPGCLLVDGVLHDELEMVLFLDDRRRVQP